MGKVVEPIRIGIVGLGANTRLRHVPGLRACAGVELTGVCNRSAESTRRSAEQFQIPKTFADWRELVRDDEIDAVVIGTWPSLHCDVTLEALEAGKHVLTEARMARDAAEARRMLAASRRRPELVAQIVPSPFGLRVDRVMREMLASSFLGRLQEVVVLGVTDTFADPSAPLHWRQTTRHSGLNVLVMGILHETLIRWVPDPVRVFARGSTFATQRRDEESGEMGAVDVPDVLHVLTEIPEGVRGLYHLSGVAHGGPGLRIDLYGSEGSLRLNAAGPGGSEQLMAYQRGDKEWREVPIPDEKAGGWRVEEEFVRAIRGEEQVQFTDFATGVRYMEFTEAVAVSRKTGQVAEVRMVEETDQ